MSITNDCESCVHFDWQQDAKIFGHPCEIHGRADSFLCSDYRHKYDDDWKRDKNTLGGIVDYLG